MKNKILMWILFAVCFLPSLLLLSACDNAKELGLKVVLNEQSFATNENNILELEYNDKISYQTFIILDNGKTKDVDEEKLVVVDNDQIIGENLALGEYSLSFCYEDFDAVDVSIVVKPKKLDMPTASASLVYNGNIQTFNLFGFDEDLMNIEGNTANIVGTYLATVTLEDSINYCWEDGSIRELYYSWGIVKKPIVKPTLSPFGLVYTTEEQDAPILNYDSTLMSMEGDLTAKVVGDYSVSISLKDTHNYIWADKTSDTFVINYNIGKALLVKPTKTADEYTYNKQSQQLQLVGFNDQTMQISGNIETNANDYTAVVSLKDSDNYSWADGTTDDVAIDWKINKFEVVVPTIVENLVYNAFNQTVQINNVDEDLMEVSGILTAKTAGDYSVYFDLKDTSNYKWVGTDEKQVVVRWGIGKKPLEKPEIDDRTYVYNGEEQSVVIKNLDTVTIIDSGNTATDAGDYVAIIKLYDKVNYKWEDGTQDDLRLAWTIEKAKLEKPIIADKVYTYNGSTQSLEMIGFDDKTMTIVSGNEAVNAGEYTAVIALKDSKNYSWGDQSIDNVQLSWKIEKAEGLAPDAEHESLSGVYNPEKTLADYQLQENYRWQNESIVPTVNKNQYLAFYNIDQNNYYDYEVSIALNIEKCKIEKPTKVDVEYRYNKEMQTLQLNGFDESIMDIWGNRAKNAINHKATVSLKDKINYSWSDETDLPVEIEWKIKRYIINTMPYIGDYEREYTGEFITPPLMNVDYELMEVTGTLTAKEVADFDHAYWICISLKDKVNYAWSEFEDQYFYDNIYLDWVILRLEQKITMSDPSKEYDGLPVSAPVIKTMENANYRVSYYKVVSEEGMYVDWQLVESIEDITEIGKYFCLIESDATEHYDYGYERIYFYVYVPVEKLYIHVSSGLVYASYTPQLTYTGNPLRPSVTIQQEVYSEGILSGWVSADMSLFNITYENNIKFHDHSKVIIEGDGGVYRGKIEKKFGIEAPSLIETLTIDGADHLVEGRQFIEVAPTSTDVDNYEVQLSLLEAYKDVEDAFMYYVIGTDGKVMIDGRYMEGRKFSVPKDFGIIEIHYSLNGTTSFQLNIINSNVEVSYDTQYSDISYVRLINNETRETQYLNFDSNNTIRISKNDKSFCLMAYCNNGRGCALNAGVYKDGIYDDTLAYFEYIKIEELEEGTYTIKMQDLYGNSSILFNIIVTK